MARVSDNVMVRGLRGLFGDQIVIRIDKAGRTIVSTKPEFDEDRVFTPAQRAQQERFRAARAYARGAKNLEVYQAKAQGTPQTPSNIAMTDWFHPPEIREIDLSAWTGESGQLIGICAMDDVQVTQVRVAIMSESGVVLEQGAASDDTVAGWWTYRTTTSVTGNIKVLVSAEDLPGHITQRTEVYTIYET